MRSDLPRFSIWSVVPMKLWIVVAVGIENSIVLTVVDILTGVGAGVELVVGVVKCTWYS